MIETRALTKHYGSLKAVERLSFSVQPGEVLGFLGPNGAGKSTTMRMIAGFVAPTSGEITVGEFDLSQQPLEAKKIIGYLPEGAPSYGDMTPGTFLNFIADVRGLKGNLRVKRLDDVIGRLHLEKVLNQRIETLSKGYKRRVGLAQAILHDPAILILDEPTDGLDPNQKHEVRQLIDAMSADKTIIISTHILEEVDAVCDRALIIANGRLAIDATPEELLLHSKSNNAVVLKLSDSKQSAAVAAAVGQIRNVESVSTNPETGEIIAYPRDNALILQDVAVAARENSWGLRDLRQSGGRLDEVFRDVTQSGDAA
jgi:ABC-2 type transport system ATP-binding protein